MKRLDALKEIGNEWQKGDYHRIYINNLSQRLGLETSHYKTGNVSGATLNGEEISNSQATKMLDRCRDTKVWWDVPTERWSKKRYAIGSLSDTEVQTVINNVEAEIAALMEQDK